MIDTALPRPGTMSAATGSSCEQTGYLSSFRERMSEKVADTKDTTVEYVQRNPYKALAVAVAAGFLMGLILKRR